MEKEREAVGTNLSSTTTSTKRAEKRLRKKKEKDILSKDKDNDRDISEGPREGRCAFFVERKKMFCRLSPLAGKSSVPLSFLFLLKIIYFQLLIIEYPKEN